ncbi:hypothetical protein BH23PLA1_BH23PLA1_02900 [soil metagenome]
MSDSSYSELATQPKTKPVLWLKFTGSEIIPERVSLSTLASALKAINRLAGGDPTVSTTKKGELPDPGLFQLVAVRRGSARYAFNGTPDPETFERLRIVGNVLENPNAAQGIDFSLGAVADLSQIAARLRCQIIIARPDAGKSSILARIGPDSARSLKDSLLLSGETSIFGEVNRVGGATEVRCALRLPSQERLLYCRVENKTLSRKLGKYLYQEVLLHGQATWMRSNWRIVRFVIKGVERPEQGDISEAFEELRQAGGSDWEKIENPEAFLDLEREV